MVNVGARCRRATATLRHRDIATTVRHCDFPQPQLRLTTLFAEFPGGLTYTICLMSLVY